MRIDGIPWGGDHGHGPMYGSVQCGIMHMTYGAEGIETFSGDVNTVANNGSATWVVGKEEGHSIALADTESLTYNVGNWDCNNHSVAIEFSGVNEDTLSDWQCGVGGLIVRKVNEAHGVAMEYDDGSDGSNNVAPWHGWNAHRAIAPDSGSQHSDFIDRGEWDRILRAANGDLSKQVEDHLKKESEMFMWHNEDVKDPDNNTPKGEWVMRVGYGLVNISQGEAFVNALAGVPWQDHCHTLHIVRQASLSAEAQRNAQAALTAFPAK